MSPGCAPRGLDLTGSCRSSRPGRRACARALAALGTLLLTLHLAPGGARAAACGNGPCNRPEMVQLLLPASGETLLLTNFGMLLPRTSGAPGGAKYELLCEEAFGGKVPARVVRQPDGRLLIPGPDGLYQSSDACGFTRAGGSVEGQALVEVAVDPADASVVWALGSSPASLHRSSDGGATFSQQQVFAEDFRPGRLVLGAAGSRTIHVAGYTSSHPLVLQVSADDGQSFTARLVGKEVFVRRATVTDLMGLVPGAPPVLLLAAGSPEGSDQIWRSTDGGITWTMTFALLGLEVQSGFALDPDTNEVFVAGRELFTTSGPPAHLYHSADGGLTFAAPIPSGPEGPRYRCLAMRGGQLHACAGEPGDTFLAGRSDDRGRTWTGLTQLADLQGRRECTGARCISTATWLCQFYSAACEGLGPLDGGAIDDAGRDGGGGQGGAPAPRPVDEGCGCRVGEGKSGGVPPILLIIMLGLGRRFMRRTSSRRRH